MGSQGTKNIRKCDFPTKMSQEDYLCLLEAVDILLDPIYFGSGNTFYEAMAVGTPLVTMPRIYAWTNRSGWLQADETAQRTYCSEQTGIYRDYSSTCKGCWCRTTLKREIRSAAHKYLFDDQEAADEVIEFIDSIVYCRRETGSLLPVDWVPYKSSFYEQPIP